MFNETDYRRMADIVFKDGFPGYRPSVIESPNGDGNLDYAKRYAHIATKYLTARVPNHEFAMLSNYLHQAHNKAVEVAIALGVPRAFWPVYDYGALRVLEYPPGAITHPHTDFDLFTLMCYRNIPNNFWYLMPEVMPPGATNQTYYKSDGTHDHRTMEAQKLNEQMHFGEILELILPTYKAHLHEVVADAFDRTQYSIVYFAIPDHKAVLPNGKTVGDWLEERMAKSRLYT